jgi:phosphoglycolate phosphatase
MDRANALRIIMRDSELVLLDFDGPLCNVFAGFPAPEVARQLEAIAGKPLNTDDPIEVLRAVAENQK